MGMPFSGLGWAALALVSGVALIVAVVVNLQRVVEQRGEQALWVAERTEDLGAKSLRRSILDSALLDQVSDTQIFGWRDGRVVIPDSVGWLVQDSGAEGQDMDALARDLMQRAQAASQSQAEGLWKRAIQDPGVHGAALDSLKLQAAWFAHREGKQEWRDQLLATVSESASVQTRASQVLLLAIRDGAIPEQSMRVFGHLEPDRARALANRLGDRGLVLEGGVQASEQQATLRAELSRLLPLQDELASAADPTWLVIDPDCLAVIFPEQQKGVWFSREALKAWATENAQVPDRKSVV